MLPLSKNLAISLTSSFFVLVLFVPNSGYSQPPQEAGIPTKAAKLPWSVGDQAMKLAMLIHEKHSNHKDVRAMMTPRLRKHLDCLTRNTPLHAQIDGTQDSPNEMSVGNEFVSKDWAVVRLEYKFGKFSHNVLFSLRKIRSIWLLDATSQLWELPGCEYKPRHKGMPVLTKDLSLTRGQMMRVGIDWVRMLKVIRDDRCPDGGCAATGVAEVLLESRSGRYKLRFPDGGLPGSEFVFAANLIVSIIDVVYADKTNKRKPTVKLRIKSW